jgi:flagellar biosynthesis anti-sigma factor FlgM
MPAAGEDTAQLSFAGGAVSALKSRLASMPEVRQERVQALRQALASGAYRVNSQQLADAVFNDLLGSVRQ